MRVESIAIKNFRSFADVTIPFDKYTCLVGPNGAGKSTVLAALNLFFRQTDTVAANTGELERSDFHHGHTEQQLEITVTFIDLCEEAQRAFADYYRAGKVVVTASAQFDDATGKAVVKQFGQRRGKPEFKNFFKAHGDNVPVANLKVLYGELRDHLHQLPPAGTKDQMVDALREYESTHDDECELIPSEDQFYGVSKGRNLLAKYVQWVFVPAVKDAATEQTESKNSALATLLERTVRSKIDFESGIKQLRDAARTGYDELLAKNVASLRDLSESLQSRLGEWAHPEARLRLDWGFDREKSIRIEEPYAVVLAGEGDFEGALARFGHGLQRSYLLALLQELAGADGSENPALILGCEEPELFQHPPQARHLSEVLQRLSEGNAQVIVATHSPAFVSGKCFESVRLVRKDQDGKCAKVAHISFEAVSQRVASASASGKPALPPTGTLAKINQALQPSLCEMFFTPRLILVEGLEDVAYITAYLHLTGQWDRYRRIGCHLVPANGKSELIQPVAIATALRIPTFVVFDSDADKNYKPDIRAMHRSENAAILSLLDASTIDPLPASDQWGTGFVMWHSDIGGVVSAGLSSLWDEAMSAADRQYGQAGHLRKNTLHIGAVLAYALEQGVHSDALEALCDRIVDPDSYFSASL